MGSRRLRAAALAAGALLAAAAPSCLVEIAPLSSEPAPEEDAGADAGAGGDAGEGGRPPCDPGVGAYCDPLGYEGVCVGEISIWADDGGCRVRDCGGEGKTCGFIDQDAGYGCVEGTQGSTAFYCSLVGCAGTCIAQTLVWVEESQCRWVDCAATGRVCAWDGTSGYNCK